MLPAGMEGGGAGLCPLPLAALSLQALLKNASATVHHGAQVTSVERLSSGKWQLNVAGAPAASQQSVGCPACWHMLPGWHMGPGATDCLLACVAWLAHGA